MPVANKYKAVAAVLLLTVSAPTWSQDTENSRTRILPYIEDPAFPYASPEAVGLPTQDLEAIGDQVASWVASGDPVGAELLIVTQGKTVFHEAYGWSDRELQRPMERNSIFRIRSMTKPLIGTAVLMLVEDGKLKLDDTAATYIPSFDNDRSRRITIRELLTHTSGLGDHGTEDIGLGQRPSEYESLSALVNRIGEIGPAKPPGDFHYSDSGSSTLGALVAEVSGMPVEEFLQERILDRLEMVDTYSYFAPDSTWAERMNSTYRMSQESCGLEKYWDPAQHQVFPFFRASGGLYSTVSDYARFLDAWMKHDNTGNGDLLSEATVESALTPVSRRENGQGYGMHWNILTPGTADSLPSGFGHGGSDGTIALAFPELQTLALLFTQSRGSRVRHEFQQALAATTTFNASIAEDFRHTEFTALLKKADQLEPEKSTQIRDRTGKFSNGNLDHKVALEGEQLVYHFSSSNVATRLKSLSSNVYMGKHPCYGIVFRISFEAADDGVVNGYRFEAADGFETEFVRTVNNDS